jgi:hypothetical protein
VNSKEENSSDFCPDYVQEFGLWIKLCAFYSIWLIENLFIYHKNTLSAEFSVVKFLVRNGTKNCNEV